MKRLMVVTNCVLLLLFSSAAYSAENNYGRFSMGMAFPEKSDNRDPALPNTAINTKYKDGLSAAGAIGYSFEKIRAEFELAYQRNDFDNANILGTNVGLNGDVSVLSFLINGYYDFKNRSSFTPYLGVGIGISRIQVTDFDIPSAGITCATDEDYVFAYQMGLGVAYTINENVSIDLGYRIFTPSDPNFDKTEAEFKSHNISLGLRIYF